MDLNWESKNLGYGTLAQGEEFPSFVNEFNISGKQQYGSKTGNHLYGRISSLGLFFFSPFPSLSFPSLLFSVIKGVGNFKQAHPEIGHGQ